MGRSTRRARGTGEVCRRAEELEGRADESERASQQLRVDHPRCCYLFTPSVRRRTTAGPTTNVEGWEAEGRGAEGWEAEGSEMETGEVEIERFDVGRGGGSSVVEWERGGVVVVGGRDNWGRGVEGREVGF